MRETPEAAYVTTEQIRHILAEQYGPGNKDRELHITPVQNSYHDVGSVHFSLGGSPPKGYAMYIPESRLVVFYDVTGREFKRISNIAAYHNDIEDAEYVEP